MPHTPDQLNAWNEFISVIRIGSPNVSIAPDTEPPQLQLQATDAVSNRQATINFVQPPDMIIHFDDLGVSASGGTSAFGIEMAKFTGERFELMRRKKQLTPRELGAALVHWLEHGTLF
jgi:hypothetical protein